jgi:6-phosphogluconolactonase
MAPGAGPRHLTFHPTNKKWIYVLNELDNTITLVEKNNSGEYASTTSISTLPSDFNEFSKSAHIVISSDGKFVYTSNRGHNSIAIFECNPENGSLRLLGFEPTHGDSPRHFSFSPDEDFLVVANQTTNNLVSFERDKSTGLLKFIAETEAPDPVCVLFK